MQSADEAKRKLREWRNDIILFVREHFKVEPDAWQRDALIAFANGDIPKLRLALQACVGPGKTAVLAWCGWWFLLCWAEKGEHPKGAAVSVTADNLKDNLWPEFFKWRARSPILQKAFDWTKERIFARDHPETWFISARSWSKTADPEEQGKTLSGLHSKYVLVLIDESGAIPLPILKAGEQALSNTSCVFGRILQAGNPISLDGMLYAAATALRHLWTLIRVTGDPEDPKRSPRIDIEWAREQIKTFGRDNPWVMSSILGLFPPSSINQLLGPDEVETAMGRGLRADVYEWAQKRLGIDVAREGDDRTVIFPRQGMNANFNVVEMRNAKGAEIASRVALAKSRWHSEVEFFDDTGGWAGAACEQLEAAGHIPVRVNFSGKADDPRFLNKRAEIWFRMAQWVKKGGSLPKIPQLTRELTAPTYTFVKGKFALEEKDQIKKRLKFSPDMGDALSLTFTTADMPSSLLTKGSGLLHKEKGHHSEWNPFSETAAA